MQQPWTIERGTGPLIATAIHDGGDLRPAVATAMALDAGARLREEDPATGRWTAVAPNRVVVHRSRFEIDLNRPRETAVYRTPAEAWGLEVWHRPLRPALVGRSLGLHDRFYRELEDVVREVVAREGFFLLLDLHSYNHRRGGPGAPADDPAANPEINVGTGWLDRFAWGGVADAFMAAVRARPSPTGGLLDVRENVRFQGGYLSRWANERFAGQGCALAVEVKKIYMDEWTGAIDDNAVAMVSDALAAGAAAALEAFEVTGVRPLDPAA